MIVSSTTPTIMIREVPENEIRLMLNKPEKIIGTTQTTIRPHAPIKTI